MGSSLAPNLFNTLHAPMLWTALLPEFGCTVDYFPGHDAGLVQSVQVIWKEGAEDEGISPGRYSQAWVQVADFASMPKKGDALARDGNTYDVVRVDATAVGFARLVLQENNG